MNSKHRETLSAILRQKHRRTLTAIFAEPVPASLAFADIEALFKSVGCKSIEGSGSRVRFQFGEAIETFHRPHPQKEAKRYQVRAARAFLTRIGIEP